MGVRFDSLISKRTFPNRASRVPIFMSVPGTAADVSISYCDSISTVPGTG